MRHRGFSVFDERSSKNKDATVAPIGTIIAQQRSSSGSNDRAVGSAALSQVFNKQHVVVPERQEQQEDLSKRSMDTILKKTSVKLRKHSAWRKNSKHHRNLSGNTPLARALQKNLYDFDNMVQSASNLQYNALFPIKETKLLSQNEILVETLSGKLLILHNKSSDTQEQISEYSNRYSKLAINSKCYLNLYGDVNWYIRWKFI